MVTQILAQRPSNVPDHLVYDFDIYAPPIEKNGDYQTSFLKLREPGVPEIFWTPRNGGHWLVTRAADIHAVINNAVAFSSHFISVPKEQNVKPPLKPIQVDPPDHTQYRALLISKLSPTAVKQLADKARQLAIGLIEQLVPRGECEFITDFAHHMPIGIFMSIVDLPPEDRPKLLKMSESMARPKNPEERVDALKGLAVYGMAKIKERRINPGSDLISDLAKAEINGQLLDDQTLCGMITLLLAAGLDTVASMLGFFARFLALNPPYRRTLRDSPALVPAAVEELLRRFAVVTLAREVTEDTTFREVTLRKGDMIVAPTVLHNLDEAKFPDPLNVNVQRKSAGHATFGGGVHRCMGAMLARAELAIFLEEWLKRIPDFEIKPDAVIQVITRSVATIPSLPLVWNLRGATH